MIKAGFGITPETAAPVASITTQLTCSAIRWSRDDRGPVVLPERTAALIAQKDWLDHRRNTG